MLAADVFIYVGELEPVFARLERAMGEGVFCFSVESLEGDGAGVRLLPSLRYAHSAATSSGWRRSTASRSSR